MKLDRRLLRQARGARVDLWLTIGLGLLAGVALVGQARVLSQVVNRVFLRGAALADVRASLFAFLALSLLRAGASGGGRVSAQRVAARVKSDLRQRLSAHVLALGPAPLWGHAERSGELAHTIAEGVQALDPYFAQYLPQLALAALVPLTILIFVFPLDLLSGLVLLLTAPLIPLFMVLIGNLADALTRRQWTALSRLSAHFLDVLQGLTTLKLLDRSRDQLAAIAQVAERYRHTTLGVLRVAFLSALALELVATLSTAVVAVQIGLRLLYGRLAFEQAFFVLLLAPEFYLPLRQLGASFHAGMAGLAAAGRIFEILETPATVSTPAQARPVASAPGWRVCFSDVHYAYDDGQRPALNGVSFDLSPGQKIALVGPSGAGKSTVAHLLLRFIEPGRGAITVNGAPLADWPAADWRAQVAWVPQNPYLFHATAAENIRLARPDARPDEIMRAAQQAHAHEFIAALPQGYDTPVGERGARLSGGQAQRIALARAFLKNAPLLVLDEATANLDPELEAQLEGALARLLQGRTALMIAHRLNTVFRADQILVLDGGRVVQAGSHLTLVEQEGPYRRLVTAFGGAA
jgi:ATP-binding cassette subfamily C protein CydD